MAPKTRKTPQMTAAMPERLRRQCVEIARLEEESDGMGAGYAAKVRKDAKRYVATRMAKWRERLPEDLRD